MQSPNRSRWPIRDILALAVVALCALLVLAALKRPGAGFEPMLVPAVGAVVMVVRYYFDRVTR
jgi:multisubunit Na+/H+ antiporter MnhB subunit